MFLGVGNDFLWSGKTGPNTLSRLLNVLWLSPAFLKGKWWKDAKQTDFQACKS